MYRNVDLKRHLPLLGCLSLFNLIDALVLYPYEINYRVVVRSELPRLWEEADDAKLTFDDKVIDVKPYVIKILRDMRDEINAAEAAAQKAIRELEEYKKKNKEFELFNKFKEDRGYGR
ncbi:hypothetical protein [Acetonema longum]|uniref:Uncharacterized protein n=1 Tax=Acetonema longum DSM 6540 TaxID=1009370 RepID=F7NKA3_9FIRM|nr:hypothetical protein [Acetonema longum]EGO63544.1 hypothetical protein ALO_12581 [Acetonema longum DSM 6540]